LQIAKEKKAKVLIQKMEMGVQLITGAKLDPVFGPVIMFGTGGIFAELFQDVSFRITPFGKKEAKEMIQEIKGYKLLKGYRNQEKVSLKSLQSILLNLSFLMEKEQNIKEVDFNPVIANKDGAVVVDAKILI